MARPVIYQPVADPVNPRHTLTSFNVHTEPLNKHNLRTVSIAVELIIIVVLSILNPFGRGGSSIIVIFAFATLGSGGGSSIVVASCSLNDRGNTIENARDKSATFHVAAVRDHRIAISPIQGDGVLLCSGRQGEAGGDQEESHQNLLGIEDHFIDEECLFMLLMTCLLISATA